MVDHKGSSARHMGQANMEDRVLRATVVSQCLAQHPRQNS